MTKVVVEAGICGFTATIEVTKVSAHKVRVVIVSECEMLSEMGSQLEELDWRDALRPQGNSPVCNAVFKHTEHAACPVPSAILKAIEVEVGMALPRDVSVRFETTRQR